MNGIDAGTAEPRLVVQTSPYVHQGLTTPGLMRDVLLALVPVVVAAGWHFGVSGLLVVAAATAGALVTERLALGKGTLADGSAAVTGLILGLTLPPGLPLWMAFVGGATAIGLGKLIWGGLGHNLFNPALVGRAFLQAAFPTALTTWHDPGNPMSLRGGTFALPFLQAQEVDGTTAATPLNLMADGEATAAIELLRGDVAGSLGETSAAVIVLAGLYLLARRAFDYRIPAGILIAVGLFSGILHLAKPETTPTPIFMLLSGGLLFGAVFMATDPVTSPLAPRGAWIFGLGVGALVVLIRLWGNLPEGVMYAILLMNAATPLLDRVTQPRVFGRGRKT